MTRALWHSLAWVLMPLTGFLIAFYVGSGVL